jgi:PAS domain-containing protein
MISYEIPMGLALLAVLLAMGTVMPDGIIRHQASHGWTVFTQPLACLLFFIAALSFTYHLHRQGLQRQDALLLQKTRQSLEQQQQLNAQLQTSNLALQRSEELLSITLNSIDDGVITTNALAQVTGINPMAAKCTSSASTRRGRRGAA